MDGVLVDNTAAHARSFQLLFRDLGLSTNALRLLKRLNGMPAAEILTHVFRHPVPLKQRQAYVAQRELLYRVLFWHKRREVSGLTAFLTAARAAGHPIGLGTGSGETAIHYIVDHQHSTSIPPMWLVTPTGISRATRDGAYQIPALVRGGLKA